MDRMTLLPTWQSWARCTYDISRQLRPTLVLNDCAVPRLTVVYSPANFRYCGGPPRIVPMPTCTFWPSVTFLSSVARGAIIQPLGTVQFSPMIANAPTSTSESTSALEEMIADGWIRGEVIGLAPLLPCRLRRRFRLRPFRHRAFYRRFRAAG